MNDRQPEIETDCANAAVPAHDYNKRQGKRKYRRIDPSEKDRTYTLSADGKTGYIRVKGGLRRLEPDHLKAIQAQERKLAIAQAAAAK